MILITIYYILTIENSRRERKKKEEKKKERKQAISFYLTFNLNHRSNPRSNADFIRIISKLCSRILMSVV